MSQPTKSETAISMANQLVSIASQAKSLYDTVVSFNARNTDLSPDTQWRLMATAAVGGDGSLSTADGSPNLAHPITVGGINRAEADLLPGLTFALELVQFLNGTLPTNRAQVNRLPTLNTLVG